MQSVMESNKTTTYSDHSDLIRKARKHESAQGYEKIWLTIRGIEPMVSDLPGWRANHYTTGARYFSCADPSICIDYCDQSSFDKSDRWHLGPEERSTHEGRHINEIRTCFDHLGLIRKARKHESAQGYERSG